MIPLDRVRTICLGLPGTTERPSHGEPAWFGPRGRMFAMFADRHHDDRIAVWCASGPELRDALVAESGHFFVPPYVGTRGWLGIWLDGAIEEDELTALLTTAYDQIATGPRGGGRSASAPRSARESPGERSTRAGRS